MATQFATDLLKSIANTFGGRAEITSVWVRCWANEITESPTHRVDVVAFLKDGRKLSIYEAEQTLMRLYDTQHVLFEFRTQFGKCDEASFKSWGYVKV